MIDKPSVSYWHLRTDNDGISRQTHCAMTEFDLKSMQPPADPQWQGQKIRGAMTTMITVQPVGWPGTWHENPKPQWIIPLSGRWFVESMDGTRVEMGPGELSFGGDQNCREVDGKLLGKILVPYRVSNLTFGGRFKNRLFIGGSHTLYAIFLNRRGARWP